MKRNTNVIDAFKKGYRITIDGDVVGLNGAILSNTVINNQGYKYFSFRLSGKRVTVLFHHLQAYCKYGDKIFKNGIQTRHYNGIKTDNSYSNILIGSQSQNQMDIDKNIRRKRSSNPIHNHEDIIKDRRSGMTYKEIMEKYNISSKGTISFIINKSLHKER